MSYSYAIFHHWLKYIRFVRGSYICLFCILMLLTYEHFSWECMHSRIQYVLITDMKGMSSCTVADKR